MRQMNKLQIFDNYIEDAEAKVRLPTKLDQRFYRAVLLI